MSVDEAGFVAHVPTHGNEQTLALTDFLAAAFAGRLHFGVPLNLHAKTTINFGSLWCWKCGAETKIIPSIIIAYGPHEYRFNVADLGAYPDLFAIVRKHIPADSGVGTIQHRMSKTQQRRYLSNGCVHCGALIGEHFEHEALVDERAACSFSIVVDERWRQVLIKQSPDAWGAYDA